MNSSPSHKNVLPVGYCLHWYTITKVLGRGGFGITYLARDENLNTEVAIKEFLPTNLAIRDENQRIVALSDDQSEVYDWGLNRFIEEARTLAKFRHPNIVLVHSVFEENNTAYIVMAYHEGGTLDDAYRQGMFQTERSLKTLLLALMDGVEEVHEANFVHRDIKPTNIYMKNNNQPVLLDFGSARQALGMETQTLTTLVSPGYAPFEQYNATRNNDLQGPWTDIYALACCAYRVIAGKPYDDALIIARSRLNGESVDEKPATTAGSGRYSRGFLAAIDAGMSFSHQQRPQSIPVWREMLVTGDTQPTQSILSDEVATVIAQPQPTVNEETVTPTSANPTVTETSASPVPSKERNMHVPLIALLLVAIGAGLFWISQDPGNREAADTTAVTENDTSTVAADSTQSETSGDAAVATGDSTVDSEETRASDLPVSNTQTTSVESEVEASSEDTNNSATISSAALNTLMVDLSCHQIDATVTNDKVVLTGFADDGSLLKLEKSVSQGYPDVTFDKTAVELIPSHTCDALPMLSPLWSNTASDKLPISTLVDDNRFAEGERFVLEVSSDLFENNHVYIDYFAIDGSVTHLLNDESEEINTVPRNTRILLGEEGGIERWDVAAPFGAELVNVIVSDKPLFGPDPLPGYETSESYASTLSEALAAAKASGATVAANKLMIHTGEVN